MAVAVALDTMSRSRELARASCGWITRGTLREGTITQGQAARMSAEGRLPRPGVCGRPTSVLPLVDSRVEAVLMHGASTSSRSVSQGTAPQICLPSPARRREWQRSCARQSGVGGMDRAACCCWHPVCSRACVARGQAGTTRWAQQCKHGSLPQVKGGVLHPSVGACQQARRTCVVSNG